MGTHSELKAKALAKPEVRAEYERLNREEFAILDEILAARHDAGLTQAQVAERMGTKAPAVARLESALASPNQLCGPRNSCSSVRPSVSVRKALTEPEST